MQNELKIYPHLITPEEFAQHEFWTAWYPEPVTHKLQVPGSDIVAAFVPSNEEMSIVAEYNGKFIGQSNANNFAAYLAESESRYRNLTTASHEGTQKWGKMWLAINEMEHGLTIKLFDELELRS